MDDLLEQDRRQMEQDIKRKLFPLHHYADHVKWGHTGPPGCNCAGNRPSWGQRVMAWLKIRRLPAPICRGHRSYLRIAHLSSDQSDVDAGRSYG